MVGAILNSREQDGLFHHGLELLVSFLLIPSLSFVQVIGGNGLTSILSLKLTITMT